MSKPINVIVYNAEKQTLEEAVITNYKDYYKHLECRTFDVVSLGRKMSIFVDDDGLFVTPLFLTMVLGYDQPLAGNLVFAGGVDSDGETLSCPLTKRQIQNVILTTLSQREWFDQPNI